jgi:hypothetical protein
LARAAGETAIFLELRDGNELLAAMPLPIEWDVGKIPHSPPDVNLNRPAVQVQIPEAETPGASVPDEPAAPAREVIEPDAPWPDTRGALGRCESALRAYEELASKLQQEREALVVARKELEALRSATLNAGPNVSKSLLALLLSDAAPAWVHTLSASAQCLKDHLPELERMLGAFGSPESAERVVRLFTRLVAARQYYRMADFGWLAALQPLRSRRALLERYFARWDDVIGSGDLPAA